MRKASSPLFATVIDFLSCARIQRLNHALAVGAPALSVWKSTLERWLSERPEAFQILFAKCRYPSIRFRTSAIRLFEGGNVDSVKRSASTPNAGKPLPIAAADG